MNLSGCGVTDPIVKGILTRLTKNTSLVTLNIGSPKVSGSCAVSLFQQMTTHPTVSITVGEVNVLGVGRVKMDQGTIIWRIISDLIPKNCVEFFRALNNSALKVSKLNVQDLTDQTADHFVVALTESQWVQALKLQHCNISSSGAVSIFRSLEHNTSLEELDLSENSQLAEGDSEAVGCAVERMLSVNRTLKVLNLGDCNITYPIIELILTGMTKNTTLVNLDMGSPKLSGSCAASLFQQMTTHPTLSTVGEVNVLGVGKVMMDRGTIWCVTGDLISENCVEFFRALNNGGLKIPNLNIQDLTDQTAEHFTVGLAEKWSVQALKLCPSPRKNSNIGSTGAVSIFRSLEHNTSLEKLDLSENSQLAEGDSEAVGCAIERMLTVNKTLKLLNFVECGFTSDVVSYFAYGLAQNHSVRKMILHCNNIGSCGAVSIFRSLEHNTILEELDLSKNSQLAEGDSEAVGCAIERMLSVNRTLKVLNLGDCNITYPITELILTGMTKNTTLVNLDMGSPKLSGSCAVSLFQQMTTHPTLSTVGEVNVLGVGRVKMDQGTIIWRIISDLIPKNCAEFFRALNNSALKVSKLNVQDLTDQTADHFVVALTESQWVQALKLQHCNISSTGVVSIFISLEHHTSLEELDLSENKLGMEESLVLAEMLSFNESLTELNLRECQVPEAGLSKVARGLLHNTSLKELDISGNKLGVQGSVALAEMLSCNKSLTELNLRGCDISEAGLTELARGLLQNTTLQTLVLCSSEKTFLKAEIKRLK